jgi:hypothetical protein
MRKPLSLLFLLGTSLSGCCFNNSVTVQVPNVAKCSPKILIEYGANCVETNTGKTFELSEAEARDVLEGSSAHPPGIFTSAADAVKETTVMDELCRALGDHCTEEAKSYVRANKFLLGLK